MTWESGWLVAGLLLAGAEMLVPGVFLLPLGLASLAAGAAGYAGAALHWQLAVFAMAAVGLVVAVAGLRRAPGPDRVNGPDAGLLGRPCRALGFEGAEGRVALGDGEWGARLVSGSARPGDRLHVEGVDGTVLLVRPAPGADA